MTIDFGLLAEAAVNKGGQLFIMGTCDRLHAGGFPFTIPQIALVLRVAAHPSEVGEHSVSIELVDEDGRKVLEGPGSINAQVNLGPNKEGAWERPYGDVVLNFQGLKIMRPGAYTFVVKADGQHAGDVKFYVKQAAQQAAA